MRTECRSYMMSQGCNGLQGLFIIVIILLFAPIAHGQPAISNVNGTITHSSTAIISGSGFGSKANAVPVAFGDMENNSLNARIGTNGWSQIGYPSGKMSLSTAHQRNSHSSYNATCSLSADNDLCGVRQEGVRSANWYAQYWVYLDPSFNWAGGSFTNVKLFRLWGDSPNNQNLRIQSNNRIDVVVEGADEGHGGYGVGWNPVIPGVACADKAYLSSRTCNTSDWLAGSTEWRNFPTDVGPGTGWHLFQFEYQESSPNTANGILRWWVDGRQVFNRSDIKTRTDSVLKNLFILGFYDSVTLATGQIWLDDMYADTTWQRVEIGNNATYNNCTLKEIQPATAWSDNGTSASITITVNQGSFADGATGYIFVTDASGTRNTGYQITFGSSGGTGDATAPTITNFTLPSNSTSLTVPITTFTANDNTAVTGYCVTTANNSSGCSWNSTAPSSITFSASGTQTAYAWARDAAGNVSASTSVPVSITLSTPVNGVCGTASGQFFSSLSSGSANLCSSGTVASFAGTGPWSWGCNGSNGGTSTTSNACSASLVSSGAIARNECTNPPAGSVFCEDFEGVNPKSHFDDYDGNPDTENLIVADNGPASDASNKAVKLWIGANQTGASDLVKVLPTTYDKLYARWYFKFEPGFTFNNYNHGGGLTAGDRSYIGLSDNRPAGNDFASFLMQPWSSSSTIPFSYSYYRGMYQNCANSIGSCWGDSFPCVYDSGSPSCTKPADRPTVTMPTLVSGQWYCYEQMIDMGTASTDGVSPAPTGRITQWLDGIQFGDNTNLWFRTSSNLKLQNLWLDLFVNNTSHSAAGELIDNIVVSTQRVGCGSTPPPTPANVRPTSIIYN